MTISDIDSVETNGHPIPTGARRNAGRAPRSEGHEMSVTIDSVAAQVERRVLALLRGRIKGDRELTSTSGIIADTGLDSVSVMDFVLEIEDEFDISIPLDRLSEVRTVGDLTDAVRALSATKN